MKYKNKPKIDKIKDKVKPKKEISRKQKIKILAMSIVTFGGGLLSWYALFRVLKNGIRLESGQVISSLVTLLFPVLSFCLWVALVGLVAVFVNKKWLRNLTYFLSVALVFIFFGISIYTFLVFIFISLGFLFFARGVRKERDDRIKFHILNCIKVHLLFTFLICVLGVSILFYAQLVGQERSDDEKISSILAGNLANIVNLVLESQFETYNPDMTLDEFILTGAESFVENIGSQIGDEVKVEESFQQQELQEEIQRAIDSGQIKREKIPPEILKKIDEGRLETKDIVEAELTGLFTEELSQARDDFLKQMGIEASGDEKIGSVIKKIVSVKLDEGMASYENIIPPVLAVTLFISLAIFNYFYSLLAAIFALVIYMILFLTGFVAIRKENREVEVAELS
ncbi:MAG: hypothetical protein U5L76_00720 [Patescibacteria group bacterium]|nr:hypothetical protein [Patescibacteria group bacterium]